VTRWLADLGAEVLKVEELGRGDYLRAMPPFIDGRGLLPALYDRGKASLELDFRSDEGKSTLRGLAEVADVVVDGARPGATARRLGLDLDELRTTRPDLTVCSVTGFGLNGPLISAPSHGLTIDTLAGVADPQNLDGHWKVGGILASTLGVEFGALNAVIAILASVMNVRLGGTGSWLDASLWDAAVEANRFNVSLALSGSEERLVMGDQGPLYGVYESSDHRLVMLAALEDRFWVRFCTAIDRVDLVQRRSGEIGFGDDESLRDELASIFATRSSAEWLDLFEQADIPGNLVLTVDDVVKHPHFEARGLVRSDTESERLTHVLSPVRCVDSGTRFGADSLPAPDLGERGADLSRRWLDAAAQAH
jgi:crotonobetainyl-CoA:carnitine CoA-transferase CaiB-like acyl-CoA transferase